MPLYDYQCSKCQNVVEVRHGFNDQYTQPCGVCGGELRRVINPAPIIFKGSGFYVTDSRKNESSAKESSSKEPASKESPSKESSSKESSTPSTPSKESAA
jgi:putative FmdB family regulatory protein